MTSGRSFPLQPRSAMHLEVGDIIAVPCEPVGWACLVVVEVRRRGPGARTTFVAGVVNWYGEQAPRQADIAGLPVVAQGLTDTELFTDGGLAVVGSVGPDTTTFDSIYRDHYVGAVHTFGAGRRQSAMLKGRARIDPSAIPPRAFATDFGC